MNKSGGEEVKTEIVRSYSTQLLSILSLSIKKECKFGAACKNLKCTFAHRKLPIKSALKWSAQQQQLITNSN